MMSPQYTIDPNREIVIKPSVYKLVPEIWNRPFLDDGGGALVELEWLERVEELRSEAEQEQNTPKGDFLRCALERWDEVKKYDDYPGNFSPCSEWRHLGLLDSDDKVTDKLIALVKYAHHVFVQDPADDETKKTISFKEVEKWIKENSVPITHRDIDGYVDDLEEEVKQLNNS